MVLQNTELEYKCLVTANEYSNMLKLYANQYKKIRQLNCYYCDRNREILKQQAVLRRRITAYSTQITFKIKRAEELLEYEKDVYDFYDPDFLEILAGFDIFPPFTEISRLETMRRLVDLPEAELCMDENHYQGITDYEIEYELKSPVGSPDSFIAILKKADILYQPNNISKFQRSLGNTIFK